VIENGEKMGARKERIPYEKNQSYGYGRIFATVTLLAALGVALQVAFERQTLKPDFSLDRL
jgi:hypothetical protein